MNHLLFRRAGIFNSSVLFNTRFTSACFYSTLEKKPLFDRILIANRGEIACRVMKTAKQLNVESVALFSDADRNSMHVSMADKAYYVGPSPSQQSYLQMHKIIDIAKKSGAQAIHPGYGFLSENAEFATLCEKSDVVFIGPPASAIKAMGSKSASKEIMEAANVPVVPGYHGENQDVEFLKSEAQKIGYPVLIKAVLGGGGKGMRIVHKPEDFESMLESSKRESLKSFGDDRVLVEKYLTKPRHIEVQIFGDKHGNYVYLFERDCSVQRRHQKVLEEAPGPGITEELRKDLGEKAVNAARAVNYVGAGTVEFIMDEETKTFYFMEMNTRLQVEHPVTEMVTQTDLVQWQLEVASGNRLPKLQDELSLYGHSFEARVYAENPEKGFLPDVGKLVHLKTPDYIDETVRIETGVRQGDEVSVYYDPMIAKVVVWGNDRDEALKNLKKTLHGYQVVGPSTNIEFIKDILDHDAFRAGDVDTHFIDKYGPELLKKTHPIKSDVVEAALFLIFKDEVKNDRLFSEDFNSPMWSQSHFRVNGHFQRKISLQLSEKETIDVHVTFLPNKNYEFKFTLNGQDEHCFATAKYEEHEGNNEDELFSIPNQESLSLKIETEIDGVKSVSTVVEDDHSRLHIFSGSDGRKRTMTQVLPKFLQDQSATASIGSVLSPMPSKITQVLVQPGDKVKKGQTLVILEAMKMEHQIKAPTDGEIERVNFKQGDMVPENKLLVLFKE